MRITSRACRVPHVQLHCHPAHASSSLTLAVMQHARVDSGPFGGLPMHPDTGVPPRMEDAAVDDSWVKISQCTFSDEEYKYLELVSPTPASSHNESLHAESRAIRKELASQPQVVNLWGSRFTFFLNHEHQNSAHPQNNVNEPQLTRSQSISLAAFPMPNPSAPSPSVASSPGAMYPGFRSPQRLSCSSTAAGGMAEALPADNEHAWHWVPSDIRHHATSPATASGRDSSRGPGSRPTSRGAPSLVSPKQKPIT